MFPHGTEPRRKFYSCKIRNSTLPYRCSASFLWGVEQFSITELDHDEFVVVRICLGRFQGSRLGSIKVVVHFLAVRAYGNE
jgi:hypothetical protein